MRQKQKKPSHVLHKERLYDPESMKKAYEAVREKGWAVNKAARCFGVPPQTLRDRTRGAIDPNCWTKGPKTTLTHEEEETLVEHAQVMAQLGYGFSNKQFQHLAGELLHTLGRKNNNKPLSNNWLYAFLTRWRDRLASLAPRKLDTARARSATPESVDDYFGNLKTIMDAHKFHENPQHVYNVDETGIQPDHRPPNVIATPGSKPQAVTSPRSTTTTLIGCANALGNAIPPFFIFKGKRFNEDLLKGASPGSKAVMSDSGWSNATIFREYLETHFLPHVGGGVSADNPVLLIFDGHASHVSTQLIDWAKQQHIILFVLPAHTSHVLQPLDVGVFGPFKTYYYQECSNFMQKNMGQKVTRYEMAKLASKAYLKAMSPANIQSAFRKTGILPLDRDVIAQEKLFPCETFREADPVEKIAAIKSGKEAVSEFLKSKQEPKQQPMTECEQCACKKRKVSNKPRPGGRAVTEDSYVEDLETYEQTKTSKPSANRPSSPLPSTSGLQMPSKSPVAPVMVESDTDDELDDDVPCCVCGKVTPPTLHKDPNIKIVTWAHCDNCEHWVHLSFCTEVRVVRRHTQFLCIHCQS